MKSRDFKKKIKRLTNHRFEAKNEENRFYVNRDGEEVVLVVDDDGEEDWVKISLKERKPFLNDKDEPVESPTNAEKPSKTSEEEPEEEASSEKSTTTRKRKTTKTTN